MKPLPKWIGLLGGIFAVLPSIYAAYEAGGWKAALLALLSVVGGGAAVTAHSLTGTGGQPTR